MNTLLEFLPLVVFFVVYKLVGGIDAVYPATLAAIVTAVVTLGVQWLRQRRIERRALVMLAVLLVLGGLTLALRDPRFIQMKPTLVAWLTALVFLGSRYVGERTLIERAMGASLKAPTAAWRRLNAAWVGFFVLLGALNLYVAKMFSTDLWVDFKLFGILGLTLAFSVLQAFWLMRYDVATPDAPRDGH